jgi:signal transduction histidine kinase
MVEDREDDAELILRELRRAFDPMFERVDTPEDMSDALERPWDLVISDWAMPRFDAMAAFAILQQKALDLPFIIVSGTIGEETAVRAMKIGVHDFMLKHQLARLIPAIQRELREAETRREAQRMHEQLVISERLASVGMLAAGVAHEINNPLAVILSNLEFAMEHLSASPQEQAEGPDESSELSLLRAQIGEPLREAREAGERVRDIVRDLKLFSRSSDELGPVNVQQTLESSLRMAWNEIRHRARVVKNYGDVPPVEANASKLGQVFVNLLVNAAQAMPEGRAEHNQICVTTRLDLSGRVVIEVRDSGAGIPSENLSRIFDPFFTTKPIGVGTGLGLAICHRIVDAFGGEIRVESKLGKGTSFHVLLPRSRSYAAENAISGTPAAVAGRRGHVLVVDDEAAFGIIARRVLSPQHDVTAVTSAAGALEAVRAGNRFDVILCDLMMPQMTGMDLHAELSRLAPDQAARMVFLTGGAFTAGAQRFLDKVPNQRIEKPFDNENLRALVNERVR